MNLDTFREWMGIEDGLYSRSYDLRKRVLEPSKKELDANCPWSFDACSSLHKHTNTFVITSTLKSMRLTRTKRPSSKPKRRFQTSLGSWHPLQVHQNLPISQRPTSLELAEEKQRSTNKKAKCSIKSTLCFVFS